MIFLNNLDSRAIGDKFQPGTGKEGTAPLCLTDCACMFPSSRIRPRSSGTHRGMVARRGRASAMQTFLGGRPDAGGSEHLSREREGLSGLAGELEIGRCQAVPWHMASQQSGLGSWDGASCTAGGRLRHSSPVLPLRNPTQGLGKVPIHFGV